MNRLILFGLVFLLLVSIVSAAHSPYFYEQVDKDLDDEVAYYESLQQQEDDTQYFDFALILFVLIGILKWRES